MTVESVIEGIGARLDASPLVIMLDVDGTLAPIAPAPEQAVVPRATIDVLHRFARAPGVTLAFVSGRAARDTWRMTGVPGTLVVGNHGMELRDATGEIHVDPRVLAHEQAVASAATVLTADLQSVAGALVENKRWTLSVHYRLVEERHVPQLLKRAEEVGKEFGLRALGGKKILELRPPVAVNKGTAVAALLQRTGFNAPGSALYAGDDLTDEDAFRTLRSVVPSAVTIRVAADPAGTSAEFMLAAPDDLRALLDWLARRRARAKT